MRDPGSRLTWLVWINPHPDPSGLGPGMCISKKLRVSCCQGTAALTSPAAARGRTPLLHTLVSEAWALILLTCHHQLSSLNLQTEGKEKDRERTAERIKVCKRKTSPELESNGVWVIEYRENTGEHTVHQSSFRKGGEPAAPSRRINPKQSRFYLESRLQGCRHRATVFMLHT